MSNSGGVNPPYYAATNHLIQSIAQQRSSALYLEDADANVWEPAITANASHDANGGNNLVSQVPYLFNGTTWDRQRTPAVFKSGPVTAAGSTGQWAPAAGKKFRLMKYQMILTGQATLGVAGNLVVDLLDSATSLGLAVSMFVPAAAVNAFGGFATPWIDLGNGVLSAVANNVLNVSLNVALTAGQLRVLTIGTEE